MWAPLQATVMAPTPAINAPPSPIEGAQHSTGEGLEFLHPQLPSARQVVVLNAVRGTRSSASSSHPNPERLRLRAHSHHASLAATRSVVVMDPRGNRLFFCVCFLLASLASPLTGIFRLSSPSSPHLCPSIYIPPILHKLFQFCAPLSPFPIPLLHSHCLGCPPSPVCVSARSNSGHHN